MTTFNTLEDAIRIAEFGHFYQRDKAGMPYIKHPLRVLAAVQEQGALPYVQIAAVLHDVTEDFRFTRVTLDTLRQFGVPEAALEIVRLVDRNESEKTWRSLEVSSYWSDNVLNSREPGYRKERDEFYYAEIRKNPGAVQVKVADINDNLQEWRLAYLPSPKQQELREKYDKAKRLLGVR